MHGKTRPAARSLFALAFAGVPQVSREMFWRLQHRCKPHEKLFGVCSIVASLTKNFLVFATPLQASRKIFWRLQHRCKPQEKLSGVCNTVASLTKNFLVFATVLQAFPKTFLPSRSFRRNTLPALCFRRTHVFYMCFRCRPATEGRLQPIPIHVVILNALLAYLLASGREAPR